MFGRVVVRMAAKRSFSFEDPPPSRSAQSNFLHEGPVQPGALPDFGAVSVLCCCFEKIVGRPCTARHPSCAAIFSVDPLLCLPQFGNIKFDSISPAIGIAQPDKKYTPMSRGAEYLFEDEEIKERSFGEHMQYYCGTSYLTGLIS